MVKTPQSKTPEQLKLRRKAEIKAGKAIGHTHQITSSGVYDACVCSCGWKSKQHWDGREWAYDEWVKHIKKQGAKIVYPKEPKRSSK